MEVINWTIIILTLGTAAITVAGTLIATFLANKSQRHLKEIEVKGQQEIKAKELLFENYQKRIERYNQTVREALEKSAEEWQQLINNHPNATEEEITAHFSNIFESVQGPFQDWIEEIEAGLTNLNATETNRRHLEFVKNFLRDDTKLNLSKNLGTFYGDFQKNMALIYALNEDLLHLKCEALFREYLPLEADKKER